MILIISIQYVIDKFQIVTVISLKIYSLNQSNSQPLLLIFFFITTKWVKKEVKRGSLGEKEDNRKIFFQRHEEHNKEVKKLKQLDEINVLNTF